MPSRHYNIPGSENISQDIQYLNGGSLSEEDFLHGLEVFKFLVKYQVKNKLNKTYMHWGDGDYFFLTQNPIGSACPGKRALSKSYAEMDMSPFVEGVPKNDYICAELYPESNQRLKEIYPDLDIDFPLEYIYGLHNARWFTQTFAGKIGVIGASPKIDLIKRLMGHPQYQEYLGLDRFEDYITIPQKYACDDLDATECLVAEQLKNSKADIFLFGIGHVKTGLAHRFKKYHPAVYIDVGAGIDCLAGVIDYERPYSAAWQNYRLKDFDYGSLDLMYFKERASDIWL